MAAIADLQEMRDRTRWISVRVGAVLGELDELLQDLEEPALQEPILQRRPALAELRARLLEMEVGIEERLAGVRRETLPAGPIR